MDRDRACEASARDSASLRTTQLQLSTANGKLHEAILRERSMDALARERAIEASRVSVVRFNNNERNSACKGISVKCEASMTRWQGSV